jgi:murein DD-endopeptidase MepM/ murein hydrolase activator NlpD
MQGFGDTEYAYNNRETEYDFLGRLHSGWDIPMATGTSLYSLGDGTVICVGDDCGLTGNSGEGDGIGIYYDSCNCVVFYLHLSQTTEGLVEKSTVSAGMVVGESGASSSGYEHLHIEIRPNRAAKTFYNPLYFFSSAALDSITNGFTKYVGNSDQWRIYGYSSSIDDETYGSFWDKTLPALWVQH